MPDSPVHDPVADVFFVFHAGVLVVFVAMPL